MELGDAASPHSRAVCRSFPSRRRGGHFRVVHRTTGALVFGVLVCSSFACGPPARCECPPASSNSGVFLEAPGTVQAIATSGSACADARVLCVLASDEVPFIAGCQEYVIVPAQVGACEVRATLSDGSVVSNGFTVTTSTSCCGTRFAASLSSWNIGPVDGGTCPGTLTEAKVASCGKPLLQCTYPSECESPSPAATCECSQGQESDGGALMRFQCPSCSSAGGSPPGDAEAASSDQ
jgi:hypothetical protein